MSTTTIAAFGSAELVTERLGVLAPRARIGGDPETIEAAGAWIDGDREDAAALAERLVARGIPTVVSHARGALAESPLLFVGGPGVGTVALARLIAATRAEALGPLARLAIRAPGGRRRAPAASRRTPFDASGRVRWALGPEAIARLATIGVPYWRVAEAILPGVVAALGVSELVPDAGLERLVAHARVGGVSVEVEVDREVRGDEDWEVEATCARGVLLARFTGSRGALITEAQLLKRASEVDARSPDELLLRHVIARGADADLGRASEVAAAREAITRALESADERARTRPTEIVLVHVPRYRNRHDELMLPSLGIARLAAFLRGYGFTVRVADLEALHPALALEPFTDDARVDAWLAGAADDEIAARLEALWPSLSAAIEPPSLVGFSIVDYFGHFQMNLASCLARLVKERTGQPTVLGGERDQVDGDRALHDGMPFDRVVDGDGEAALLALACEHAYADRVARDVPAVWSRVGGAIVKNRIVRSHLNAMPRPDFDDAPLERYRRAPSAALRAALARDGLLAGEDPPPSFYLPYGFVKGCVADCTFCSAKEHLDVQAPEKTVDELLALAERHGTRDFVFLNNLVNLGRKWLDTFCQRLIDARADLAWTDSCRPTGVDLELAHTMYAAGCRLLNFGAESGSDAVLTRMKKGLRRADILSTLRATHAAGIINRVNLIAGYFHETEADVDQTISLVEALAEEIDVIGCFQGFYLFSGMGVDPEAEGIVLRDGLDRLRTGQMTLAYDEIGGLRWEEKRERIDASRNRILARIEALSIRTLDKIDEYDLFYLARTFRDPAITRRYVLAVPPPEASRPNQAALLPGGVMGRVG